MKKQFKNTVLNTILLLCLGGGVYSLHDSNKLRPLLNGRFPYQDTVRGDTYFYRYDKWIAITKEELGWVWQELKANSNVCGSAIWSCSSTNLVDDVVVKSARKELGISVGTSEVLISLKDFLTTQHLVLFEQFETQLPKGLSKRIFNRLISNPSTPVCQNILRKRNISRLPRDVEQTIEELVKLQAQIAGEIIAAFNQHGLFPDVKTNIKGDQVAGSYCSLNKFFEQMNSGYYAKMESAARSWLQTLSVSEVNLGKKNISLKVEIPPFSLEPYDTHLIFNYCDLRNKECTPSEVQMVLAFVTENSMNFTYIHSKKVTRLGDENILFVQVPFTGIPQTLTLDVDYQLIRGKGFEGKLSVKPLLVVGRSGLELSARDETFEYSVPLDYAYLDYALFAFGFLDDRIGKTISFFSNLLFVLFIIFYLIKRNFRAVWEIIKKKIS